jgi:hypothetical protein
MFTHCQTPFHSASASTLLDLTVISRKAEMPPGIFLRQIDQVNRPIRA